MILHLDGERHPRRIQLSETYSITDERMQANMVLIRHRERLRDVKVEGNAKEIDAFVQQILEQIMGAVKDIH